MWVTKYFESILYVICLVFLAFVILRKGQNKEQNWAMFFASLFVFTFLPIVNYICVQLDLWYFLRLNNRMQLPYNLYILWIVFWGIVPTLFFKGKHILIIALSIFWIDILLMPILQRFGYLHLNDNWYIGELALLIVVFLPSYYWAALFLKKKKNGIRTLFQIAVMIGLFLFLLPSLLYEYTLIPKPSFIPDALQLQLLLIIVFPALVAAYDLVKIGKGTPFPYDQTKQLVRSGVYAYCRNPIQLCFTFMFIPLSIYFETSYLLIGVFVSIFYTIGISNLQESEDMTQRFGNKWKQYYEQTPAWYFQWKPKHIPQGTIYFDYDCSQCSELMQWFKKRKTVHLTIKPAASFCGQGLLQVTYLHYSGKEFKSIEAIAYAIEHINLAYACLGWFMRMPGIKHLLQLFVDAMGLSKI